MGFVLGVLGMYILNANTTHTHKMQNAKMQILLLPLSGHAHLAEPGCLCTKQALEPVLANSWSQARSSQED